MSIHCARNCALELFFHSSSATFLFHIIGKVFTTLARDNLNVVGGGTWQGKIMNFSHSDRFTKRTPHPFVWLRLSCLFANSLDKRQIKQSVICKGKNIVFCTKAACVIFFGKPGKHMDRATWRMRKAIAFKQQMSQCRRKRYRHDLQVNISAQSHPVNRPRWSLQARGKI